MILGIRAWKIQFASILMLAVLIVFNIGTFNENRLHRNFIESINATGAAIIEMDHRTGRITNATSRAKAMFGREVVGLDVHDIMAPEYREVHDKAIAAMQNAVKDGTFRPRAISREAYVITLDGKNKVSMRVYATGQSRCYALFDPVK